MRDPAMNSIGPEEPDGWVQPPWTAPFDWDGDRVPDELVVAGGEVRVRWADGEIVVTGVRTDWHSLPYQDDAGVAGQLKGDQGKAYGERHRPAAVGDVTGDGLPDLVVSNLGHTSVLIGSGPDSEPAMVPFASMGVSIFGWHSPPMRATRQPDSMLTPLPVANVEVIWDYTGDGVLDFAVTKLESSTGRSGPQTAYFSGLRCDLPATKPQT